MAGQRIRFARLLCVQREEEALMLPRGVFPIPPGGVGVFPLAFAAGQKIAFEFLETGEKVLGPKFFLFGVWAGAPAKYMCPAGMRDRASVMGIYGPDASTLPTLC